MVIPGGIPVIGPPPPSQRRAMWSVMIPTFHCAGMLAATLESVLAEDPGPELMHIEVIDDHSTDDNPERVVREVGQGRIDFFRQPRNVGISRNFTTCLARSCGDLVHLLHGDDVVYPGFYAAAQAALVDYPEASAVIVGSEDIDEGGRVLQTNEILRSRRGILDDPYPQLFGWNPIRAPGIVARRRMYEQVGGFRDDLRFCADWDMWKRLAVATPLVYDPQILVGYRVHGRSDTAQLSTSVGQLREMIDAVRIAHGYLPLGQTRAWTRKFYGTTRRWAWAKLRQGTGGPTGSASYAALAVESLVRQQADRLMAVPHRLAR